MLLVDDDRILRTGMLAVVGAVAVSLLLGTVGDPWRTGTAAALAVALVALGSPHGALDHLVLVTGAHLDRPGPSAARAADGVAQQGMRRAAAGAVVSTARRSLRGLGARFVLGYAGLALLSLVAYLLAPRAGFALFLVLSVAHFAAGEAGVAVDRGLARGWTDPLAWAAGLGGAVVIVLPLASREATAAVAAVDPRLAPVLSPLAVLAPLVALGIATAVTGCLVAALRGCSRAPVVAVELMALTALSVLADPLVAFAAYFAFWHSLRHQARLAQLVRGLGRPPAAHHVGRPLREVVDSALPGVPATIGVVVGAGVLAVTGTTLLGGLLAVIWALTVPHSCAVAVLEVRAARRRRDDGAGLLPAQAHGTSGAAAASNGHDTHPHLAPVALGGPPPDLPLLDRMRG